jgi:UDP-3-O-[3-hydroxymyristoyl] glucosamine N-acyltransferase
MRTAVISFSAALLAFIAWAASPVSVANDGRSINSVNGQVVANEGQTYETLSTVNGQVRVARGVTAREAKTVNGQVLIEEDVKLGKASTVNGQLRVGDGSTIEQTASTVNGSVKLGKRVRVGGDVSTVSGEIELDGAEVGGSLSTHNGDIELSDGAHVRGNINVKKKNDSGWSWGKDEPNEVRICSTCVVDGELRFERPVDLYVQPGAKIGKVIGESVTRH